MYDISQWTESIEQPVYKRSINFSALNQFSDENRIYVCPIFTASDPIGIVNIPVVCLDLALQSTAFEMGHHFTFIAIYSR